jgi:hypothetical protein
MSTETEEMAINIIVLQTGETIISQMEQLSVDIGEPDYLLTEPFLISRKLEQIITFSPWLIDYTNQNKFRISSEKMITIAEPKSSLIEKYKSLLK